MEYWNLVEQSMAFLEEQAWQKQAQAKWRDAATNTMRAQEDYDTSVVELDRKIAEKKRMIEDMQLEKDKVLRQADREIEDAKRAQSAVEGGLDLGVSGVSQVRERQERIALLTEPAENEGMVKAECAGDVLEVMIQSGMRMGTAATRFMFWRKRRVSSARS